MSYTRFIKQAHSFFDSHRSLSASPNMHSQSANVPYRFTWLLQTDTSHVVCTLIVACRPCFYCSGDETLPTYNSDEDEDYAPSQDEDEEDYNWRGVSCPIPGFNSTKLLYFRTGFCHSSENCDRRDFD